MQKEHSVDSPYFLVYLLLILRLDLRNMPDMQNSCFWHLVAAKLQQQKKSCCTASSTGFAHCHMPVFSIVPQLPLTASSKQLLLFICRSTSFSFAGLALPLLELALVAPSPTKAKLCKCIFKITNPVCERWQCINSTPGGFSSSTCFQLKHSTEISGQLGSCHHF